MSQPAHRPAEHEIWHAHGSPPPSRLLPLTQVSHFDPLDRAVCTLEQRGAEQAHLAVEACNGRHTRADRERGAVRV